MFSMYFSSFWDVFFHLFLIDYFAIRCFLIAISYRLQASIRTHTNLPTRSYDSDVLRSLNCVPSGPQPTLCSKLRNLGLHANLPSLSCHHKSKRRRPFKKYRRNIRVLSRLQMKSTNRNTSNSNVNAYNLVETPLRKSVLKSSSLFRISLFSAHSVGSAERRIEISNFVTDQDIDILFITETWLKENGDEPKCSDVTPPGYSISSFPRNSRGGGIAILAKNHVFSRLTFKSIFDFDHSSFELVQTTLTLQKRSVHFFCLYRPPPSLKNKLTDSLFLEQFPKLLDLANSICGNFLILGDFNSHFDCPTSSHVSTILDYMHMFNLVQSVSTPTHRCGHTLDWILYRPEDDIMRTTSVSHELTSDHLSNISELDLSVQKAAPVTILKRNLSQIDKSQLNHDICMSQPQNPTAEQLDQCLRHILDKHAPAT